MENFMIDLLLLIIGLVLFMVGGMSYMFIGFMIYLFITLLALMIKPFLINKYE